MTDNPFINLYTSDFLAGTSGMTAATKGVYITLLCQMYESEAPLAQEWETLARRCGCTKSAFRKAIEVLADDGKISVRSDGLWSPKCDKHIALRRERRDSASAAAKKRWDKSKQKQGEANAAASSAHCQPKPKPKPYIKEDTNVSLSVPVETTPANDVSAAVSRYNQAADKAGWPQVQKLTPNRSKQLRARLVDCGGSEGWEAALRQAFNSDFCRGRTPKPWTGFGFDWLIKSANFTKLMEGNYDNRSGNPTELPNRPENRPDPALEQIARLAGLSQTQGAGGCGA